MFIQIGKVHFRRLVYIDTHSGPGIAKIGAKPEEIVLGSPLIALRWPEIVAERVPQYRQIGRGFDELYFIDIDPLNIRVLKNIVKSLDSQHRVKILNGDSNRLMNNVMNEIMLEPETLLYVFVDPFGELDSQLGYNALSTISSTGVKIDLMMSLHAHFIARAFSGSPDKKKATRLFGEDFCRHRGNATNTVERFCSKGSPRVRDVLEAYRLTFQRLGFRNIEFIPVKFQAGTIYYLLLATTHPNPRWINGYLEYIQTRIPDLNTIKKYWLQSLGKIKPLDEFF